MNKNKRVTALNIRNMPVDTKALFKGWCASKDYTMEKAVAALLKKAIAEDMILPSARKLTKRGE